MIYNDTLHIHDYAYGIIQRAARPIEVPGFHPDWDDQPSRYKIYQDVERTPLPLDFPAQIAPLASIIERLKGPGQQQQKAFSFQELSTLLQFAHGILNRRLDVNWNRDQLPRNGYATATYGRGTASGGGMYPTEIFWVSGPGNLQPAGIYHYDNAHHALSSLARGNYLPHIYRAVQNHPTALASTQFLLISLNFWKNAFKYNNFCYHVVTQDLGALLTSLRFLSVAMQRDLSYLQWFADEQLNTLLGLKTREESVFAVIPLPGNAACASPSDMPEAASDVAELSQPFIHSSSYQRSQRTRRFEAVEQVHLAGLLTGEPRPCIEAGSHDEHSEASEQHKQIELPAPSMALLQQDILTIFKQRKTSFGRFSKHQRLTLEELTTILYAGAAVRQYASDMKDQQGHPAFTDLMVFINNVAGIEKGSYLYDAEHHRLKLVQQADFSTFLQDHYFLQNYSMAETGAVITIVGDIQEMLHNYKERGYRLLNMEVGMVAQSLYLSASAMAVGSGAVLGFDNVAINTALGLAGTDRSSLLFVLIGHERTGNADFISPLV